MLTGMGSSQFALYPLSLQLIAHGWDACVVETAELLHYQPALLREGTLLIAASQSGRSAEIVRLMEFVGREVTVVGVTNDRTSPLAVRSDVRLDLNAGPESTVSCKTYLNSLVTLDWLGAVMTEGDLKRKRAELQLAGDTVAEYLSSWRQHVDEMSTLIEGVERIFVTGRGPSLASAQTGGLILKESTRFAAEGMSCPAFRHGPLEAVAPNVLVMICEGDPKTSALNRALAHDVESGGGRVAILGPSSIQPACRWADAPSPISTVMEMLPIQMLSLALAASTGREAGRFEKASKITSAE
ncbi:MAG: SIS domain-containing protein [Acidobacteria bacterium]|nr:SIS domain-containing protein [Acidobacteriota bacterium]